MQQGQEMTKRPLSVTIIAWLLIVAFVITILNIIVINVMISKGVLKPSFSPTSLTLMMTYLGLLVQIISAIGMLKGKNWARWLYTIGALLALIVTSIVATIYHPDFNKTALILPCVIYLAQIVFLFRSKANEYFEEYK